MSVLFFSFFRVSNHHRNDRFSSADARLHPWIKSFQVYMPACHLSLLCVCHTWPGSKSGRLYWLHGRRQKSRLDPLSHLIANWPCQREAATYLNNTSHSHSLRSNLWLFLFFCFSPRFSKAPFVSPMKPLSLLNLAALIDTWRLGSLDLLLLVKRRKFYPS